MTVLWIVVGFSIGFFAAYLWQQYRWKRAEKRWLQQRKEMQRQLAQAAERVRAAEQKTAAAVRNCKRIQNQQQKGAAHPDPPSSSQAKQYPPEKEKPQDIGQTFQSVESLKLQFQYLLPDSLILQTGTGFLRSAQNELIPEPDTFQGANKAAGYAMKGLFYLYDVVYHEKEYTFQQIMAGEMGDGYVRIHSIIAPAKVARVGGSGYYGLAAKGKLRVTDMQ